MSNINAVIDAQADEYKTKFDKFCEIALWAKEIKDEELEKLAIKRAAGLKMMVDYMPRFKAQYKKP